MDRPDASIAAANAAANATATVTATAATAPSPAAAFTAVVVVGPLRFPSHHTIRPPPEARLVSGPVRFDTSPVITLLACPHACTLTPFYPHPGADTYPKKHHPSRLTVGSSRDLALSRTVLLCGRQVT